MSINDAMLAGVTGLIANSSALSAISDNIANSQTIGYKDTQVNFSTLITGQSTAGATSAGGVMAITGQNVVQQGQLQSSSSPTALAIQGDGFFCCTNSPFAPQSTTPVLFTRAGQFTQDKSGYLVNSAGLYLQGWPVNANGVVQSDPTNLTKLQPINVTAIAGAAEPTTSLTLQGNLSASQPISTAGQNGALPAMGGNPAVAAGAGGYDPTANSMAAFMNGTGGVQPDYTMQLPVSDSKGTKQELDLCLLKSSVPNEWYAEIVANPPNSVTSGPGVPPGQVAAGMIAFTPDVGFAHHNDGRFERSHGRHGGRSGELGDKPRRRGADHLRQPREQSDPVRQPQYGEQHPGQRHGLRQPVRRRGGPKRAGDRGLRQRRDPRDRGDSARHRAQSRRHDRRGRQRLFHLQQLRNGDPEDAGHRRRRLYLGQLAGILDRRPVDRVH
jgi:flagellar hook-basal body protein